ncbi:hypothetical protein QOT17_005073 [Balamuthia mandrillaris]
MLKAALLLSLMVIALAQAGSLPDYILAQNTASLVVGWDVYRSRPLWEIEDGSIYTIRDNAKCTITLFHTNFQNKGKCVITDTSGLDMLDYFLPYHYSKFAGASTCNGKPCYKWTGRIGNKSWDNYFLGRTRSCFLTNGEQKLIDLVKIEGGSKNKQSLFITDFKDKAIPFDVPSGVTCVHA